MNCPHGQFIFCPTQWRRICLDSSMTKHQEVLQFIIRIQACFPGSIQHCRYGYCFEFADLLLDRFPEGKKYYDEDHMITKIEDNYYDITGEVARVSHRYVPPGSAFDRRIKNLIRDHSRMAYRY